MIRFLIPFVCCFFLSPVFGISVTSGKSITLYCSDVFDNYHEKEVLMGLNSDNTFWIGYDRWTAKIKNKDYKKFIEGLEKAKEWLAVSKKKRIEELDELMTLGIVINDYQTTKASIILVGKRVENIYVSFVFISLTDENRPLTEGSIRISSTKDMEKLLALTKNLPTLKTKLKQKIDGTYSPLP